MSNPLAALVPAIPQLSKDGHMALATVVSIEPLRITLDFEDEPADVTPLNLVRGLTPGDRVFVMHFRRKYVVLGQIQPEAGEIPTNVNLNTLTRSGQYWVTSNGQTSTARNFPIEVAGRLTVEGLTDGFAVQRYRTWTLSTGLSREFVRDYYAGSWRDWVENELWTQWTTLSTSNGWTSAPSGSGALAYRQSALTVELRGAVSGGTINVAMATLPTAARPSTVRWIKPTAWTGQTSAWRVNVNTNGTIATQGMDSSPSWISFDNVRISL